MNLRSLMRPPLVYVLVAVVVYVAWRWWQARQAAPASAYVAGGDHQPTDQATGRSRKPGRYKRLPVA